MIDPQKALLKLKSEGGGLFQADSADQALVDSGALQDFQPLQVFGFSADTTADVFFWQTQMPPYAQRGPNIQGTQDCVSHAFGVGLEDWFLNQLALWPGKIATEVLYGGSRTIIGNKTLQTKGTSCAWVAHFIFTYGFLPRGSYVGEDLTEYNPLRADRYGRDGLPNVIVPRLQKEPRIKLGRLKSANMVWSAVGKKMPVPFATRKGFSDKRSDFGICRPEGEWHHAMLLRGRCIVANGAKCFAVQNSIGDYLGDTNQTVKLLSGESIQLPAGVFLVEYEVFDDICKTEDVYVLFI